MKKILPVLCALFVIFLSGCKANISVDKYRGGEAILLSEESVASDIASVISPAIVAVTGIVNSTQSVGSGVCLAENGYILTNSHVINGAEEIILYLSDKTSASAKVLYEDTVNDLAILKSSKALPYLMVGSSDDVLVGEEVLAVGTPLSLTLTHTFTKGIVSAKNRTIKVSSTEGSGYMQNLIQHDASLNPGNSGGPLINSKGQVIGINTLKISGGEGIGFAIPSKSFVSLLSNFATNINYEVPYLGVYGYDSEIAEYYGNSDLEEGFYIIDISDTSPLGEMDIKSGAVITKLDGYPISNASDLRHALYSNHAKDVVSIEYYMAGKLYSGKIKLSKV